jgi:DNA-binding NarL/FixJ family response regulator
MSSMETTPIRVMLVDDEPNVRRGLTMRLGLEPDIEVVGEAADGSEALALAQRLQPDVVLMDVEMRDANGLEAAYELHMAAPQALVIMLSMHDDAATKLMARTAGAIAFVSKHEASERLLPTIRAARRG